jgi:hypothetical protein
MIGRWLSSLDFKFPVCTHGASLVCAAAQERWDPVL